MIYRRIDKKGRIAPGFYLEEPVFSFLGDREIILYSKSKFKELEEKYNQLNISDEKLRYVRRIFFSKVDNLYYDKQKRLNLCNSLRRIHGISIGDIVKIEEIVPGVLRIKK